MLRARWSAARELALIFVGRPLSGLALFLLAHASPVLAADPAPATETMAVVQVAVDPSTGRPAPLTPDQRAKLSAALAQMIDQRTEGLEVRRLPNGAHLVDLQGRFQSVEVAVRGTDGQVHLRCIDSPTGLAPAPRPATEER